MLIFSPSLKRKRDLILSDVVEASILEVPHRLSVTAMAWLSSELQHVPVHYQLVSHVVGLRKEVVVGWRDEEGRSEGDSSEPEEVSHVHESYRMEGAHRDIKLGILEG